jgi:UBX domain-containing protein 1
MHLWADGVSIDDGPLFRFDDPANQPLMEQINQGHAPLSMLDVQPGQEVDLNLDPHKDENYVKPKPKYKPFGGSGQRLGSPTPGVAASSSTTTAAPATSQQSAVPGGAAPPTNEVDESAPTVTLQVRLGDGTRLQSRFNTTQTIGDVYDFVSRASPASAERAWALMTTFPSKELEDKSVVLGDMSDFKRGGVVVQKWK